MQVHHKPRLDDAELTSLLQPQWSKPISNLTKLVEGEDSQAFRFISSGQGFVVRINKSEYGFRKDAYAYSHFSSPHIPIPQVAQVGRLDNEHFFCISEYIDGPTLQDLDETSIKKLLPQILTLQHAVADTDISNTVGFGEFGLSGPGKSESWHRWLSSHLSMPDFDWESILNDGLIDHTFLTDLFESFRTLVEKVPNDRQLYHGDFGSNNLLVRGGNVAAVIDWDAAGYGDWLFDVAGAYYWRNHILCMGLAAEYYEKELADLPNYRDRINCYQLRAALIELYVQAKRGEKEKLDYHLRRTRDLLEEIS